MYNIEHFNNSHFDTFLQILKFRGIHKYGTCCCCCHWRIKKSKSSETGGHLKKHLYFHEKKLQPPFSFHSLVVLDNAGFSKGYGFIRFGDEKEQQTALASMMGASGLGMKPIRVSSKSLI